MPLQAWSGPEGSRELRFLDFMTTAQDGLTIKDIIETTNIKTTKWLDGGKVVSLTQRPPLPPGNTRGTHFF